MKIEVFEGFVRIQVNKAIYSIDVLHKCFYWYGNNYDVTIESIDAENYKVELTTRQEQAILEGFASKIKRDLIDFKLRDVVAKETQTIRELIVAKAFANYEDASSPDTELSDPVGFDPLSV